MSVKFTPPGPAFYFATPSSFAFDGVHRTCVRYKRTRNGMRCKKYRGGRGTPPCGPIKKKNLRVGRATGGHGCRK